MSDRREFTSTAPAKPIVLRPHHPELEPLALAEPRRRRSHRTRKRIMYLVGLLLQASVLALLVAGFLTYEGPIRAAAGLPAPAAPLAASLGELEAEVAALAGRVEALATTVGAVPPADGGTASLAQQLGRIAESVSRLEAQGRGGTDRAAPLPAP